MKIGLMSNLSIGATIALQPGDGSALLGASRVASAQ
jgi:hypothetical protein